MSSIEAYITERIWLPHCICKSDIQNIKWVYRHFCIYVLNITNCNTYFSCYCENVLETNIPTKLGIYAKYLVDLYERCIHIYVLIWRHCNQSCYSGHSSHRSLKKYGCHIAHEKWNEVFSEDAGKTFLNPGIQPKVLPNPLRPRYA